MFYKGLERYLVQETRIVVLPFQPHELILTNIIDTSSTSYWFRSELQGKMFLFKPSLVTESLWHASKTKDTSFLFILEFR